MFALSRRVLAPVAAVSVGLTDLSRRHAACESIAPGHDWIFDPKGIPTKFQADVRNDATLYLAGVGTRRKNLYLVNLDIYYAALALPASAVPKVIEWSNSDKESRPPLTNFLLKADKKQTVKACILLKPIRNISTSQFLSAMTQTFIGTDPDQYKSFHELVERVFGTTGATTADVIAFYFMEDGELILSRNGTPQGSVSFSEISHRLMDVYLDPKRAVTPELNVSVEHHINAFQGVAR